MRELRFFVTSVPRDHMKTMSTNTKSLEQGCGLVAEHLFAWHTRGAGSNPNVTNGTFLFAFSLIYIPGNHVKSITLL